MPLIRDQRIRGGARLCIWQVTEHMDQLPVPERVDLSGVRSEARRLETLAVYALLHHITGRNDLVIAHDATGKPVLDGWVLSISHTRGWAALVMSRSGRVAVDIEYVSDRVARVARRFIRPDEKQDSLSCQLINWSAKETVYKFFNEDHLEYFEMRLPAFEPCAAGTIPVENLKTGRQVRVDYELNDDYVLTYAVEA